MAATRAARLTPPSYLTLVNYTRPLMLDDLCTRTLPAHSFAPGTVVDISTCSYSLTTIPDSRPPTPC
eukprot:3829201-Pleurochrysis_carterae.AAC.1